MAEPVQQTPARTSTAKKGHPALFVGTVAAGFLVMWVVGIMTQIQTNEAYITNSGQIDVYHPNWLIMLQLPGLITGNMSSTEARSSVFAWGIELVILGLIIGYEVLHDAASKSGPIMAKVFIGCVVVISFFNAWTDHQYGSFGSGEAGRWGFAIVTSFIVGFFGTIGMHLLSIAWKKA